VPLVRFCPDSGLIAASDFRSDGGKTAKDNAATGSTPPTVLRELPQAFEVLSAGGNWRIRQINRDDMDEVRRVVMIQAEGFHVPNPVPFLDSFFKKSFTAEARFVAFEHSEPAYLVLSRHPLF
jgi:hypothetical protein